MAQHHTLRIPSHCSHLWSMAHAHFRKMVYRYFCYDTLLILWLGNYCRRSSSMGSSLVQGKMASSSHSHDLQYARFPRCRYALGNSSLNISSSAMTIKFYFRLVTIVSITSIAKLMPTHTMPHVASFSRTLDGSCAESIRMSLQLERNSTFRTSRMIQFYISNKSTT